MDRDGDGWGDNPSGNNADAFPDDYSQQQDTDGDGYGNNPNGSVSDIAGITNASGSVLGLMPHPERAGDPATGGTDGRRMLEALLG